MTDIEFIEKYCLVNGEHIKLKDYQKAYIKWLENLRKKKKDYILLKRRTPIT